VNSYEGDNPNYQEIYPSTCNQQMTMQKKTKKKNHRLSPVPIIHLFNQYKPIKNLGTAVSTRLVNDAGREDRGRNKS